MDVFLSDVLEQVLQIRVPEALNHKLDRYLARYLHRYLHPIVAGKEVGEELGHSLTLLTLPDVDSDDGFGLSSEVATVGHKGLLAQTIRVQMLHPFYSFHQLHVLAHLTGECLCLLEELE